MQLEAAMSNTTVVVEEIEKESKKAFELQHKLEKVIKGSLKHTKCRRKWRKSSLPDPSIAIEKRAAKLEELYNDSVQEIQVTMHRSTVIVLSYVKQRFVCLSIRNEGSVEIS